MSKNILGRFTLVGAFVTSALDLIQRYSNYVYYRDAIIGLGIICNTFLDIQKYDKACIWTERLAELIRGYEKACLSPCSSAVST